MLDDDATTGPAKAFQGKPEKPGPASTGKKETITGLGSTLSIFVVVTKESPTALSALNYSFLLWWAIIQRYGSDQEMIELKKFEISMYGLDLQRWFPIWSNTLQPGLWGCFDEFTRNSSATLTFVAAKDEKPLRSSLLLTQAKKQDARQKIHTTKRIYRVFQQYPNSFIFLLFQTDKQGSKRKHEFSVLLQFKHQFIEK